MSRFVPSRRLTIVVVFGVLSLLVVGVLAGSLAFRELIPRQDFDTDTARESLPGDASAGAKDAGLEEAGPVTADERADLDVTLLLGSDAREGLGGARADVTMLGLLPADGRAPALVSIPRDLWVANPCTGGPTRINAGLAGCGEDVSGPELVAVMVEDLTGVRIDHSATLDFEAFREIVDLMDGVEICVEHPVRDYRTGAGLDLPAGCTVAAGDDALAWVTSRTTQEHVDGTWRSVAGVSDLTRNQRQRDLIRTIVGDLADSRSPGEVLSVAREASRWMSLDDDFDLLTAVRAAWSLRAGGDDIRDGELGVRPMVTSGGAQVLVPTEEFDQVFARVWPESGDEAVTGASR